MSKIIYKSIELQLEKSESTFNRIMEFLEKNPVIMAGIAGIAKRAMGGIVQAPISGIPAEDNSVEK